MVHTISVLSEETAQLGMIGTDDVYAVERLQAIVKLCWCAKIWNWFPDEERPGFRLHVGGLATQCKNILDKVNAAQRRADEVERLGPE
jgi:hypothetical protein